MPTFITLVALYAGTGILQPIIIDSLRMNTSCLGRRWLLLPTLCNTMGMTACGILSNSKDILQLKHNLFGTTKTATNAAKQHPSFLLRKQLLLTAAVDLMSGMLLTGGMLMTGGAVFVVLYNSCPAWTALLSKFFLGQNLSHSQIFGISLVCVGLLTNVLGSHQQQQQHQHQHINDVNNANDADTSTTNNTVMVGSIVVLVGCVLHSGFFVLSELSLRASSRDSESNHVTAATKPSAIAIATTTTTTTTTITTPSALSSKEVRHVPVVSPSLWSCCLGTIESVCMLVWVIVGIGIWGFHGDNPDNIDSNDSSNRPSFLSCSVSTFINRFSILLIVDAIHAGAFFLLLKNIGAVGSALLKGTQAVAVVLLSAAFFCHVEQAQCLTVIKSSSIVLVLAGTICYAIGSNNNNTNMSKEKGGIQIQLEERESLMVDYT